MTLLAEPQGILGIGRIFTFAKRLCDTLSSLATAQVSVTVPVPPGTKGKQLDVHIGRNRLRVGLKGGPPTLEVGALMCLKVEHKGGGKTEQPQRPCTVSLWHGAPTWPAVPQSRLVWPTF
jgi:hypothetical protein